MSVNANVSEPQLPTGGFAMPSRRTLRLIGVLLLWTAIAVLATTTAYLGMRGQSFALWLSTLQRMLLYYYSWAFLSVVMFSLIARPLDSSRRVAQVIAGNIGILTAVVFLLPFIAHADEWRTWLYGRQAPGFQGLSVAIYLFVMVGCVALKFYQQSLQKERERAVAIEWASLLEVDLNHARVDLLKMQINPHFMFNALNSIAALVETNKNTEAYRTTELLGSMLRQTLALSEKTVTPLRDELSVIETYIALEGVRFGDRLSFTVDVADACLDVPIPILIMQPVIENTIKHAVGKSEGPVHVRLVARIDDAYLTITVADDGPGFAFPVRDGIGHKNISRRLNMLYGEDDLFSLEANDPQGAVVRIKIPLSVRPR